MNRVEVRKDIKRIEQKLGRLENEQSSHTHTHTHTHRAELILQPFRHFTYVIAHSPTLLSLYLRLRSFSNPSVASPTSQLILQPFRHFSYVTSSSLNSFSNPSVALPTSQLILQPFRCFSYVIAHSATLLSLLLRHRLFTYVTWRAANG